jgi:hypothetical protein
MFAADPILPPDPEGLDVLHDREYRVRGYRVADDELLLRGAVRDQKPPGLYVAEDPDPLTMHHMQVELRVAFPSLQITAAAVIFETHPHGICPNVVDHYGELVGLSIARGFTHKVRELFGGPRGCTHTTALLLAMAPVAIQCTWSMQGIRAQPTGGDLRRGAPSPEDRQRMLLGNLNTCHVWAEDSEHVAAIRAGDPVELPITMRERFRRYGVEV